MSATIVLVGRIVGDIETRQAGQSSVTRVRIPTDAGWGDSKQTTWWSVELWGKRGETLAQHGSAGDIICVTGEPCVREYAKNDGTKGYSCDIKNASWSFAPKPSTQSRGPSSQQGNQAPPRDEPSYGAHGGDGDIPF